MNNKVEEYLNTARNIALEQHLDSPDPAYGQRHNVRKVDPLVIVGIATMLQRQELDAPDIIMQENKE